jgi:hypothetical protein
MVCRDNKSHIIFVDSALAIQLFLGQLNNIQKYSIYGSKIHYSPPLKGLWGNIIFLAVASRMHVHLFKPDCSSPIQEDGSG